MNLFTFRFKAAFPFHYARIVTIIENCFQQKDVFIWNPFPASSAGHLVKVPPSFVLSSSWVSFRRLSLLLFKDQLHNVFFRNIDGIDLEASITFSMSMEEICDESRSATSRIK